MSVITYMGYTVDHREVPLILTSSSTRLTTLDLRVCKQIHNMNFVYGNIGVRLSALQEKCS